MDPSHALQIGENAITHIASHALRTSETNMETRPWSNPYPAKHGLLVRGVTVSVSGGHVVCSRLPWRTGH